MIMCHLKRESKGSCRIPTCAHNLHSNMLRTVFDHICGQIDTLVQDQMMEIQGQGLKVKV